MGNLNAFLKPAYRERQIEIVVGDRFLDEEGNPVPVVMHSLTQVQMQEIAKASTKTKKVNNVDVSQIDSVENINRCLVESISFPNLRDHELCVTYGTEDPVRLPPKLFLVDEYNKLVQAFAKLNGIDLNSDGFSEVAGEVTKN